MYKNNSNNSNHLNNNNYHHNLNKSSRVSILRKQYRILDESTRNRRNRQHLEQLERDNFHEDPHSNLVMHKKAPKFEDPTVSNNQIVKHHNHHHTASRRTNIQRSRIFTLNTLIEENSRSPAPNYLSIATRSLNDYSWKKSYPHINNNNNNDNSNNQNERNKLAQQQYSSVYFPFIKIPSIKRYFCSVCGFKSNYTCIICGYRYCSQHCQQIHSDTRCLKWTG